MTVEHALRELRDASAALEQNMADEQPRQRLRRSVIRPLDQALAQLGGPAGAATDPRPARGGEADPDASAADGALDVARRATRLRVEHDVDLPLEVLEAVAGLQDLAVTLAPDDAAQRRALFADMQASLPSAIHTEAAGPYLVTNGPRLCSWLGRHADHAPDSAVPLRAVGIQARLRRHPRRHRLHRRQGPQPGARPGRYLRRSPTHRPRQPWHLRPLRVLHRRLPTVFQRHADAFVAPSGSRQDEMVRAVRACPSGALSLAGDEREAPRPGRPEPRAGHRGVPGRALPDHRRDPAAGRAAQPDGPQRRSLARALQPLPLRALAEQAVLQRHALVHRIVKCTCPSSSTATIRTTSAKAW
jgi:Divergent 4Fe-4S mono-cluster